MLEVSNFTPTELSVKLLNDKTVVVEGKHGERPDVDGFVSREFTRKYNLPESVVPSTVECYLSKDGVLVIRGHAPRRGRSHVGAINMARPEQIHDHNNLIPIFTQGYHTRHSSGNSNASTSTTHKERIIPISQEPKQNGNHLPTAANGKNETKVEEVFSGRNSRSSDRESKIGSPRPTEFFENGTVSFNDDDDTIARLV